ncbi:cupin domain-containing protein [Caulobacter sp. RHG1]|uniref:cupin domain-containing protein n=1 Tax=Caulobacter sp. (strain RHG1) TaxID=2545762 RepID=UPI00155478A2|nr:cupin domain-containing protein [Caulobacter sp. RHG1]NQE61923.1 putative auxin-binding protein [Caulobacter sp. RHG1]
MPKIDIASAPTRIGTAYPAPFNQPCLLRHRTKLGDAVGLDQFGVNLLRLPPGQWSSQRHWHTAEDEFTWVVEGEVVLVDNHGETVLRAGECAGFKAGVENGHHFQNRSDRDVLLLEIGARRPAEDGCDYPDIDLVLHDGESLYRHRDGAPYDAPEGRKR